MKQAEEGMSLTESLDILDSRLTYGGVRKISEYEAELLDRIDESYDSQIKMQREMDFERRKSQKSQEELKKTEKAIEQYCSETTRDKRLLERGWQFMPEKSEKIRNTPSDREEIDLLKEENNALKTENLDLKERFTKIRTFITERCSRIPILGKILVRAMKDELGEKQLSQPISKKER